MSLLSQFRQGGIQFRGAYAEGITYYRNSIVTWNNLSYICIAQSVGNLPTDTSYWQPFVAAPDISVSTVGAGVTPATFTLTSTGATVTLNKPN